MGEDIHTTFTSTPFKVFWPALEKREKLDSGFLVGWILPNRTVCIASIVSYVHLCNIDLVIDELANAHHPLFKDISNACGSLPSVVGITHKYVEGCLENVPWLIDQEVIDRQTFSPIWFSIQVMDHSLPCFVGIRQYGQKLQFPSIEFTFYKRPNPKKLQFISLEPIELDISLDPVTVKKRSNIHDRLQKIDRFAPGQQRNSSAHSFINFSQVINQINAAYELDAVLRRSCHPYICQPKEPAHGNLAETIQLLIHHIWLAITGTLGALWPLLSHWIPKSLILVIYCVRMVAEGLSYTLNKDFGSFFGRALCAKDLSATAQQLDLRLQQICFWPWQYLLTRRTDWAQMALTRAHYISFYNGMWLVANDIIFGVAIGAFLADNNSLVAEFIANTVSSLTLSSLSATIVWLMNWPAGLKLNSELGAFLGDMFQWLIDLWAACLRDLSPWLPFTISLIGICGIFGASMILALSKDLLSFLTIHIYWFYVVAARIYNWQLTILYSLFNLFRGKKRNMLRHRIDSCDYDLDRLLLGTILFTLLTFLFPTITVYYFTFALGRLAILSIQAFLETLLAFLNHFPLFALMLRIKDPERLPGGLRFKLFSNEYVQTHKLDKHKIEKAHNHRQRSNSISSQSKTSENVLRRRRRSSSVGSGRVLHMDRDADSTDKSLSLSSPSYLRFIVNGTGNDDVEIQDIVYMEMENLPIRLRSIFFQYLALGQRAVETVVNYDLQKRLLSGQTLVPLARLQYSLLPAKRPSLYEFWEHLNNPSLINGTRRQKGREIVL